MRNQSKKIGFLCLVLVVSGGWITLASRQSPDTAALKADDPSRASVFLRDPNFPALPGASLNNGELFVKMMLSVVLIIGLGGAALYLSRRILPRVTHAAGKEVRVLETTYLGPRKALHLIEVGGQRLLLASTSDHVTMLAPVNEAWLELPRQESGEAAKTGSTEP